MMVLQFSKKYQTELEKYIKGNRKKFDVVKKTLYLFVLNQSHPSLHVEKLKGSTCWTMRLNSGDRIFFLWINKTTVLFVDIGPHDKYRKY